MLRVGELPHDELDRSIASRHDNRGPSGDELFEIFLGVELDDQVVGELGAKLLLDLSGHRPGFGADDQQLRGLRALRGTGTRARTPAAGRVPLSGGGGSSLGYAQLLLPSRRIQRAQANEWRPRATKPSATTARSRWPYGWLSRKTKAPLKPLACDGSRWSPAWRTNQPTSVKVTPLAK